MKAYSKKEAYLWAAVSAVIHLKQLYGARVRAGVLLSRARQKRAGLFSAVPVQSVLIFA